MAHPDALRWNLRYIEKAERYARRPPRPLVTSYLDLLPPGGLVLDAACGISPTGRYLAAHGWRVIALDISIAALRLVRKMVGNEKMDFSLALMDMTNPWLPPAHFDVILNFNFLSRPLWPTYRRSLKPGGLLFFETFLRESDVNPQQYLDSMELITEFGDWGIIHYEETQPVTFIRNGEHITQRAAQLVARKPQ